MLCYRQLVGTKKVLFNGLRSWQQNLQRIVKSTESVVHSDQEKMKGVIEISFVNMAEMSKLKSAIKPNTKVSFVFLKKLAEVDPGG